MHESDGNLLLGRQQIKTSFWEAVVLMQESQWLWELAKGLDSLEALHDFRTEFVLQYETPRG